MFDTFAADFANTMAWFVVGLVIGALPYYFVSRSRPDVQRPARGVYVGLALGAAFLISDRYQLVPDGEAGLGPVIESGRIERPVEGFVVTFPKDWTVVEVTPEAIEKVVSDLGPENGDPLAAASTTGLPVAIVMGFPPGGGACGIYDISPDVHAAGWTSVDEVVAGSAANNEARGWEVSRADSLDHQTGLAGRIDATDTEGLSFGKYYFVDEDTWISLVCHASQAPNDDWLSIAETFEFAPVEEE